MASSGDSPPIALEQAPAAALPEREVSIRRAAIELFFRHGYAAVGIRQIGTEVGLSTATLYHYYESKLAALESIMEDSNVLVQAHAERAMAPRGDPRGRFTHLAGALVATQVSSRKTCYVIDNEVRALDRDSGRGEGILRLRRDYERLWREAIAASVATGEFTCESEDVARVSLIGMYSQTSLWYRPNAVLDQEGLCVRLVNLGLAMLRAPALSPSERGELLDAVTFEPFLWEPEVAEAPSSSFPEYADLMG